MLDLFTRFLKTSNESTQDIKSDFFRTFFEDSLHHWILEDKYVSRAFKELLGALPISAIEFLHRGKKLSIVKANGIMSCALAPYHGHFTIIIFPDLLKLLRSANSRIGEAILAHEIGHLYSEHAKRGTDPLWAQVEADRFAYDCGYGAELEEILLDNPCLESSTRLTYLTGHHYATKRSGVA